MLEIKFKQLLNSFRANYITKEGTTELCDQQTNNKLLKVTFTVLSKCIYFQKSCIFEIA